ncbi:MAG: ElyC/SanA/YdcF family protein [Planctomycetaceae bacterium]
MDSSRAPHSTSGRPSRPLVRPQSSGASRPTKSLASSSGGTGTAAPARPRRGSSTSPGSSTGPRRTPPRREASRPRVQPYLGEPLPEFDSAPAWPAISRGVAFFLGSLLLLNLGIQIKTGSGSTIDWWLNLSWLPPQQAHGILGVSAATLLLFAIKPTLPGPIRLLSSIVLLGCAGLVGYTTYQYYLALHLKQIHSNFPVAFSLHILAMLAVVFAGMWKTYGTSKAPFRDFMLGFFTFILCIAAFPIAQMFCYGRTDYRQPANAIVVFGCRADADGTASLSLRNRMSTGIELFKAGLAPALILSGGPGEGDVHETEAMKQIALEAGIPATAIILDEKGWSTSDTLSNIKQHFMATAGGADASTESPQSILAVSNFYHLPRIQMIADREELACHTVPAAETSPLEKHAVNLGREIAALWWYQIEPLVPATVEQ